MTTTTVPEAVATRVGGRLRDRCTLAALAIGAAGLVYRVAMLAFAVPPTNSDEATIGLAALHIATGRDFPVFFYGQHYMGALEAYLAAPLTLLFGQHTVVLRIPLLLMYAGFLVCGYRLARRLYPPGLALVTVALLALGSDRVLKDQMLAAGGYPEITFFGALLMLLAVRLASGGTTRRGVTFAAWGLVAGLCLWVDWLVLPYVAASAWLIVARCRSDLRRRYGGGALLAGLLLGAAPVLGYNLGAAPGHDSISVFLRLNGGDGDPSLGARLYGGVLFGVPMGTGLCSPSRCAPWQLWWGVGYPVLLVAALVLAIRAVRVGGTRGEAAPGDGAVPDVRRLAHLALLVAAAVTLLAYARSAAAGQTPVESARYLACLLISTPAVLWPLWSVATRPGTGARRRLAAAAPVAGLLATAVLASVALVAATPGYARRARDQDVLVGALRQRGLTRIYSEYWTCNRIAYATREQVVCAVLGDDLRPGYDRYAPYRSLVAHAPRPAYVLPAGGPLDRRFAQVLADSGVPATVTDVAGYRIYQPDQPVPVPLPPRPARADG
ncbi:MAG TPA: hypothetical protein VF054_01815 [Micromonosporaceae bacterium]